MSLDATIGGTTSNSYVTAADADAYFADHLDASVWDASSVTDEALVTASLTIDSRLSWLGSKSSTTQSLEWPRTDVSDDIGDDIIPIKIKRATYELALHYIKYGMPFEGGGSGLESIKFGSMTIDLPDVSSSTDLPENIMALLLDLGSMRFFGGAVQTPKLIRV